MSSKQIGRRSFLSRTASVAAITPLAASSYARVIGSNDRISVGIIGCGSRGNALLRDFSNNAQEGNAEIVAVCDIWNQRREETRERVGEQQKGRIPRAIISYPELLGCEEIDAVIIATIDHQHPVMLKDAAEQKKDVYVEKPLSIEWKYLKQAFKAVQDNNIVVQNGTQLRSWPSFNGCREFVQSGALGKILRCEQARSSYRPYWHSYKGYLEEKDTDWKAFLMHAPKRPWDADVYTAWMGYRPFSNGALGGMMSHFIDLVHFITGAQAPHSAVAGGGIYVWKDARTVPDAIQATMEYPEEFQVSYCSNYGSGGANYFRIIGTKGVMDLNDWNQPVVSGEGSEDPDRIAEKQNIEPIPRDPHMLNWLKCIRSRKQPNAGIDAGFSHAVAAIMSDEAFLTGRRMIYDPERRKIKKV